MSREHVLSRRRSIQAGGACGTTQAGYGEKGAVTWGQSMTVSEPLGPTPLPLPCDLVRSATTQFGQLLVDM